MKNNKNKLLIFLALFFNILLVYLFFIIAISKKIGINILSYTSKYIILDIFMGLIGFIGIIVPPILLTINLFRNKEHNSKKSILLIPFLVSLILFYLAFLQFLFILNIYSLRIFLIPTIIFVYYVVMILIKVLFVKKKYSGPGAQHDT